jgi:hypothetical protein
MDRQPLDTGRIYTASILFSLTTAATEIFSLLASSLSRVEIMSLDLQQNSTLPQAISVEMYRGSTGGSTGAAIVPANRSGWAAAPASTSVVTGNSTTLNSTTSSGVARIFAGGFKVDSGNFRYAPTLGPVIDVSQRFSARVSAPSTAAALSLAGLLTYRETGKTP